MFTCCYIYTMLHFYLVSFNRSYYYVSCVACNFDDYLFALRKMHKLDVMQVSEGFFEQLMVHYYKWKNHFFKMKGGYRDGLKHQKGRNKGSLHRKVAQSYMTPSLYISLFDIQLCNKNNDIGMVSCSFVQLFCVMTPCFFLFGASNHPYIPLSF